MEPTEQDLSNSAGNPTTTTSRPSRWRRTAGRLALAVAVVVVLFSILEVGFRVASNLRDAQLERSANLGKTWAIYDEELGYRLRPKAGHPLGLKSPTLGKKLAGRPRILFLGDSIPHGGDSISDTLVARAQAALLQAGHPVELINAGIPGYTTYQELGFLKKFGLDLAPDVVVMGFCVNDLHKFLHTFKVKDGKIIGNDLEVTQEAAGEVHGWLYMLARKSMFLRWVRGRVRRIEQRAQFTLEGGYLFDHRSDLATAWKDRPWEEYARYLDQMVSLGREHHFRVVVVAFPFAPQYRKDYLKKDRDYVLKPQARLTAICRERGVPCLDLYDTLNPQAHFVSDGIHLSAAGRKKVGEVLARFLVSQNLVP